MSRETVETHMPVSSEEIARTFEEAEAPVDLSGHGLEDWVTLAIFWMMCGAVFLQFFTRYVLNNSFAWTEEIAIYCLVAVVFLGSVGCVRQTRHIHVDFLYRMISPPAGRVMATLVDIARIVVFAYLALLVWRYSALIHDERMTTIDFPKSPVFLLVFASFVLMALRGVQVLIANIRRGYSVLERPGAFDGSQEG
ncbi:MAG: TRAP transporter small permease [Methylobacterium sp.]|nr:TRAP transporter small permease [Methylobacterium sp.]MCA3657115.1 TRAP transporter small permease [Methylobacterium sp.]MCA3661521.1 TRAP transporter small permease [Methylobacterium sp.]MCA3662747.1 TRAP transporter small permease [Methylobacterium sp.]MCA3668099.1 TRAP transporter small permease [Methylobacterium sp.]